MRRRRLQPSGASRGFTLLELVIVMTIIAIAFFAVRPSLFRTLRSDRERATIRQVVAFLSSARTEAVARGRLVRVVFDGKAAVLWAERQADPDPQPVATDGQEEDYRNRFDVVALMGRERLVLPEYLTLSRLLLEGAMAPLEDERMMYFFPDGRTTGASLLFEGETGQHYIIDVSPATGKVQLRA